MELIDISVPFSPGLPVYPGDPALEISPHREIAQGSPVNTSILRFGSHTGTHIDAPRHFFEDGPALDELPPERFICRAIVTEMTENTEITMRDVACLDLLAGDAVLFKTRGRMGKLSLQDCFLSGAAAGLLVQKKAGIVATECLSIDAPDSAYFPAHRTLLRSGVLILEGLDLTRAQTGIYTLIALPLGIPGGNGCPVRAVLMRP